MQEPEFRGYHPMVKTVMDRLGAAVLLLLAAPWFVLVTLAIWLDSPGPVFTRDRRFGQWGAEFDLLRFRGTVSQVSPEGPGRDDDGRQGPETRVGRLLRRYSLDELPQLINVLNGDMSFVGPRPRSAVGSGQYVPDLRRLALKPGLSGLWLASRRGDLHEDEPVDLDRYLRNWSLALDLAILWHSLRDVLRGAGGR